MRYLLVVVLLLLVFGHIPQPSYGQPVGVSAARFANLAKGINLSLWFWYPSTSFSATDLAQLKAMGFTYVRVPIALDTVYDAGQPNRLHTQKLATIDNAIQMILASGLAVVVDIQALFLDTTTYVYSTLQENDPFFPEFLLFWQHFAAHLSTFNPEKVFLEPLNEPVFTGNTNAWLNYQQQLVTTIRQNAPQHTILVTNAKWSTWGTLIKMTPLSDPNVVYNFHYYDPFIFTHQGAAWSGEPYQSLSMLPYPSSVEIIDPLLANYAGYENDVRRYGRETWNYAKQSEQIGKIAAWADRYGVRLVATEFGVHKPVAPREARLQWTYEVRTLFESHGIGWAMWSYEDNFGLIERAGGVNTVDYDLALALGLNPTGVPMNTPTPTPPSCVPTVTAPTPLDPPHRQHLTEQRPSFTWTYIPSAQSYRLMIYRTDRSFEFKKRIFDTTYTLQAGEGLAVGKYLWRMRAQDALCGTWSAWSGRNTLFID